jgi:hypothetical protein
VQLSQHELSLAKTLISKDRMSEAVKQLEAKLKAGQIEEVEAQLQQAGLKWEESGFFDLTAGSIPKMGALTVLESLPELVKSKSYLSRLIREGETQFVVKFKEQKELSQTEAEKTTSRSPELIAKWIEDQKTSSHIEKNEAALR